MDNCYKRLVREVLANSRTASMNFVERTLEKIRTIIFTTNDYYLDTLEKMRADMELPTRDQMTRAVQLGNGETIQLSEIAGAVTQQHKHAWRMKVSAAAYWKVVQKRLADEIPLEIRFSLQESILETLDKAMYAEVWSAENLLAVMEEDPLVSQKRMLLQKRIDVLQTSLNLLSKFMVSS
jgi:hypothetical protein